MTMSLTLKSVHSLHVYVHDLEQTRALFCDKLDFAEIGHAESDTQISAVFQAGACLFVASQPVGEGGRAARFLAKHPAGIGTVVFEVEDIDQTAQLLDERGATLIDDIQTHVDDDGTWASVSVTTPFGDTTFRFVERAGYRGVFPGFERYDTPRGGHNRYGFTHIDHITSNFATMSPALLWLQHVLGFERYWDVAFHTAEWGDAVGSGLKSVVMWDPASGIKLANNEPARPYFKKSQINVFFEDHRGPGVQHAALATRDIQRTVRGLRADEVAFMPTPNTYYDALPQRLERMGVGQIDEDYDELRDLEILVDGEKDGAYLLQIFLAELAELHDDKKAGPFFLEIIERKGDDGFGAGNFLALFESIERQQTAAGRA